MPGPGTEMHRMLSKLGITPTPGCGCEKIRRQMDLHGCQWSLDNMDRVVTHMRKQAQRRKIPFSAVAARMLLKRAVKKSRADLLYNFFDRVYCVNLRRRPDRLERIKANIQEVGWPFKPVQFVPAVDGKLCQRPEWWRGGGGAWGCYRTHVSLMEACLNEGVESVLLLEDDALFPRDFVERAREFLSAVPEDWGMIYLGGQHLKVGRQSPTEVEGTNGLVYVPYNVNRTHAFGLRGRTMTKVYRHCCRTDWTTAHHIDHHLGRLHQRREDPVYVPSEWLVAQAAGRSNVSGRNPDDRWFNHASHISGWETSPFVAVIGLHSSGSSCLAGVLHHLGVNMGDKLGGYWGGDPDGQCGFEAAGLAALCEAAIPFPKVKMVQPRQVVWRSLRQWINQRRQRAVSKGTIAGGKYPQLCRMGHQLRNVCGKHLRIVNISRPLEESIESIIRRCPDRSPEDLAEHQTWLDGGRDDLLAATPPEHQITVEYADLLANPRREISRLVRFLDLKVTKGQFRKARDYVKPEMRHVEIDHVQV